MLILKKQQLQNNKQPCKGYGFVHTEAPGEINILRVRFFGKNPNPDSESKNGFLDSLAKSKKRL